MEYLQIVLNGYIDQNSRMYLVEYFIREAKKAKIKDFNYDEFFNGCLGIVEAMEQQLKERLNKTKSGLDNAIISARNRTLKSDAFDRSKDYSTQCNEAVIRFKDQISELNLDDYILNLWHFTNGYATGNLPYHEIQIIKDAITKAKLQESEGVNVNQNSMLQLTTDLTADQKNKLYELLVKGKFIPENTDKDCFNFALGNPLHSRPEQWKPITWNEAKQGLRELLTPILGTITNQHIRDIKQLFLDKKGNPLVMIKPKKDENSARCSDIEKLIISLNIGKNPTRPGNN